MTDAERYAIAVRALQDLVAALATGNAAHISGALGRAHRALNALGAARAH